jgi:hypothetical protein
MTKIINAPINSRYCSEFMTELPKGIVNKHETGVGASVLALEDQNPYILAVPTIEIIRNKIDQYPNERRNEKIFGFYGGINPKELTKYIKEVDIPKIMVTYDSFHKVVALLKENKNKYRILVDEFSDLLDAYSYRDKAIDHLLTSVKDFEYVTYISATPIKPEYYPESLKGLDEYEINWGEYTKVKVERKKTNKPYQLACNIIEAYKAAGDLGVLMPNGYYSKSAYFFVNSVNSIVNIIDAADLRPSEVRVICADNKANQSKLDLFKIEKALDPEKKFNFITSTAFKGCDFYSETGVVYIVSNTQNKNTLISIDTDIRQIAGRIRTLSNPFRTEIYHIFNTDASLLSKEEFDELIQTKVDQTNNLLSLYHKGNESEQKAFLIDWENKSKYGYSDDNYISKNSEGELYFNYYMMLNDKRRWEVSSDVYRDGLSVRTAYVEAGFELSNDQDFVNIQNENSFINKITKNSFKSNCINYIDNENERTYLGDRFPLIKESYEKLGPEKMKAVNYLPDKLMNELKFINVDIQQCIKDELARLLPVGECYPLSELKNILNDIYSRLHISKKGKAIEIANYGYIKFKTIRLNGKFVKVAEIISF